LSWRSDDLDSVGELCTEDDFWQLVVAIEATPAFLGGLGELEDHRERGLIRKTSLRAHGAVTHGGERAFDNVARAQMFPVLSVEDGMEKWWFLPACPMQRPPRLDWLVPGICRQDRSLMEHCRDDREHQCHHAGDP
jgi:hypothetical protein